MPIARLFFVIIVLRVRTADTLLDALVNPLQRTSLLFTSQLDHNELFDLLVRELGVATRVIPPDDVSTDKSADEA